MFGIDLFKSQDCYSKRLRSTGNTLELASFFSIKVSIVCVECLFGMELLLKYHPVGYGFVFGREKMVMSCIFSGKPESDSHKSLKGE